jgi:hypothetical protein
MDWSLVTTVAAVFAAVGALAATLVSLASWRLQRTNQLDNEECRERLRVEERYFKLHVLWQELRVTAITLQGLPLGVADYAPHLEGLPITQLTEALATKDLLSPEGATRVRIARDDLVQLEQLAGDGRNAEARRVLGFEHKFPEQLGKAIASVEQARQTVLEQLPAR